MPLSVPSSVVCICQVLDIWGSGSVFTSPFFPCQTVKSSSFLLICFRVYSVHETVPTDSVYSCCLDLWPSLSHRASSSIIILQVFLGLSVLCCSWGFQLEACFCMAEGPFVSVCSVHFYFCSIICTGTGFSCACIYSFVSEILLGHKILKTFQTHLFLHFHVEHMYIILHDKITWQPFCTVQILKDQGQIKAAAVYVSAWAGLLQTSFVKCVLYVNS